MRQAERIFTSYDARQYTPALLRSELRRKGYGRFDSLANRLLAESHIHAMGERHFDESYQNLAAIDRSYGHPMGASEFRVWRARRVDGVINTGHLVAALGRISLVPFGRRHQTIQNQLP